jgi:hypothetical protein
MTKLNLTNYNSQSFALVYNDNEEQKREREAGTQSLYCINCMALYRNL